MADHRDQWRLIFAPGEIKGGVAVQFGKKLMSGSLELLGQFIQSLDFFLLGGLSNGHQAGCILVEPAFDRLETAFGLLEEVLAADLGFAFELLAVLRLTLEASGAQLREFGPIALALRERLHQF